MKSSASIRRPREETAEQKTAATVLEVLWENPKLKYLKCAAQIYNVSSESIKVYKSQHAKLSVFLFTANPYGSFISPWNWDGSDLIFALIPPSSTSSLLTVSVLVKSQYVVIGASINHPVKGKVSLISGESLFETTLRSGKINSCF